MQDRDRDERGRARNARPRDALGRPLAHGEIGVSPWPEQTDLPPEQSLETAQQLLDRGRPFQAHEVLEAAWKSAPGTERALWQGLAQLAVGVTHAARGNPRGATTLLERGAAAIAPFHDAPPHAVDVPGLLAWTSAGLDRLASAGDAPVALDAPRLRRS